MAVVVLTAPAVVLADGRVALVVGNSTYAHIGRLPNTENDAVDMAAVLRRLGFEVTTELDADRVELTEALRAFARRSAGADVALVFYAGHGSEMDGANYLAPVDTRLERDLDVRYETVTLDDLLVSTLGASLGMVNEPLLADETLVAYAAAGTTAADGRGRNSPYTAALLARLEQPLEIGLLFRRVRAQVLASTNGQQRPHEYQSLVGEHYLSVPPTAESVTVGAVAAADAVVPLVADVDIIGLDITQLLALAEGGSVQAQVELGERYEHGRRVGQDDGVAMSWFRRAAKQGHAPAQAALGVMYRGGRSVAQNYAEAVRWFRRAAEQGNARGQSDLGAMYGTGRGVTRDEREAVGGSAVPPNRDSPWGKGTSVRCTATGAVWRRTTRKRSVGSAAQPSKAASTGRPFSVGCTPTTAACSGATRRLSAGTAARPSRATPPGKPASAGCTSRVEACRGIAWKRPDGTAWPLSRGMRTPGRGSTAFGERRSCRSPIRPSSSQARARTGPAARRP